MNIKIKKVPSPRSDHSGEPVMLSDETIEQRKQKLLKLMKDNGLSSLIVYADKEHGSNFEYLTGFIPRFEEGLQILNQDGHSTLILGNENFNKVKFSRVKSEGVHCQLLSLQHKPMNDFKQFNIIKEGLQILNQDGHSTLILGNENFNKVKFSRVKSEGVHCPLLSLPNQPMNDFKPFHTYLEQVNIDNSSKIGLVGWKLLSNDFDD